MRAISIPCFTGELKSTNSSLIWPETCEPTCTDVTGLSVPVDDTVAVIGPFSTFAVRNFGASSLRPAANHQPPPTTRASIEQAQQQLCIS